MSNNRVKIPGQVDIACVHMAAPSAYPSTMVLNMPEGPKAIAFGGLSKLEWMSGMVISGFDILPVADVIVDLAASILAECERRQHAAQEGNGKIEAE